MTKPRVPEHRHIEVWIMLAFVFLAMVYFFAWLKADISALEEKSYICQLEPIDFEGNVTWYDLTGYLCSEEEYKDMTNAECVERISEEPKKDYCWCYISYKETIGLKDCCDLSSEYYYTNLNITNIFNEEWFCSEFRVKLKYLRIIDDFFIDNNNDETLWIRIEFMRNTWSKCVKLCNQHGYCEVTVK